MKRKTVLSKGFSLWPWALTALVIFLWLYSRHDPAFAYGASSGGNFKDFLLEMLMFLPAMFVLIGLFDVWVPRKTVEKYVGRESGIAAIPWMVLLAMLQAGPLYACFPVAVMLWRKGCSPRNVFIYIGAFSTLKIPMLTFEVAFMGWQFSLARALISLPVFIVLSYLLEKLLPVGYIIPTMRSETTDKP
jgi:uncharacterized membrane protein YraQ (UPF0718 family)